MLVSDFLLFYISGVMILAKIEVYCSWMSSDKNR